MQLSMETVVLRNKFGDETAIRMLKEAGFDGIDYSFYWPGSPERNMLGEDYISRAREVKSYLKAMDMNCLQAHAPLNPRPVASLELSDLTCLELIRSIEFSGILGVKTLVVHAITPPEGRGLIEYNLEFYRFLEPFAREAGVCIAVENLFGPPLERPEQMTEILQNLNSEQFTGCLDVEHSMYSGIKTAGFSLFCSPWTYHGIAHSGSAAGEASGFAFSAVFL